MPLALYDESSKYFKFAVWQTSENISFYLDNLNFNFFNSQEIRTFSPVRLKEWCSVRYLAQIMLMGEEFYCTKTPENCPVFVPESRFLTFSHSGNWASAAISENEIGIDIQKIDIKILKVKNRVFTEDDLSTIEDKNSEIELTVLWTIKEATYKAFRNKGIAFKNDISIRSLDCSYVYNDKMNFQSFSIKTIFLRDYIISIAFKK